MALTRRGATSKAAHRIDTSTKPISLVGPPQVEVLEQARIANTSFIVLWTPTCSSDGPVEERGAYCDEGQIVLRS